ncbi:MAG: hypothetical protein II336_09060 [Loktanella sp.]|nr:hypothetical protein [Loktanella sp.]
MDEVSDTQALFDSTGGNIDLRTTGTDGAPTLANAVTAVRSRIGRAAIRAMLDGGRGALRSYAQQLKQFNGCRAMPPGLAHRLIAGVVASMVRTIWLP